MKDMNNRSGVFDWIAPIYGLFYNYQTRHYKKILDIALNKMDFSEYKCIIDVGCGTGALCSLFDQMGFKVTGVDPSQKMLRIAINKQNNKTIEFIKANVLGKMPFEDKSFDISISAYVAHGLNQDERKIMYAEMSRITKYLVIIYDYNEKRSVLTSIIEWLEGGDYFNFIKQEHIKIKESFREVRVLDVDLRAVWYVCVPTEIESIS
jgi:ubiquinone/menaquinone biosynthesis C-methylase UbiE